MAAASAASAAASAAASRTFLPAILLLFLLHFGRCQDPEITESILPEIKRMGVTGRLNCTVTHQLDYKVQWYHTERMLHISSDEKIEIEDRHNTVDNGHMKYQVERLVVDEKVTYRLIVNRLERVDSGNYTCTIQMRGTGLVDPSKNGELIVLVPPSIRQGRTSRTMTVREGFNVSFHCDAEGYPSPNISWVRVNGGLLPNGKLRERAKTLNLTSLRTHSRGIYRCLADNNVRPPAVYDVILLINFRPVARAVQSSYGQAENRMFDVTIECTIAGWPEPDLQWYKESSNGALAPIDNDDKHSINILLNHANVLSPQERWFQLVIRVVTANDFGYYQCEGKNNFGSRSARIHLFATSECQGPVCPPEGGLQASGVAIRVSLLCILGSLSSAIAFRKLPDMVSAAGL